MAKRTGKYYFKNEKQLMKELGLEPTKGSGSGWIEKEDGQNEHVICQLKSTDASSIKINKLDIEKLECNAYTCKKIPLFVIEFLKDHSIYFLVNPLDVPELARYIKCGTSNIKYHSEENISLEVKSEPQKVNCKIIKSSKKSREKYWREKYGNNKN